MTIGDGERARGGVGRNVERALVRASATEYETYCGVIEVYETEPVPRYECGCVQ